MTHHPWKVVFVLLAILATAVVGRGFAEQSNGSPDGSYAVPNAGPSASNAPDSTSDHPASSYPALLDRQGERSQRDLQNAEATRQASVSEKRLKELAASDGPDWSPKALRFAEGAWVAILAGVGLLVSLAVGGYVWWSRTQSSKADGAILLPMKPEPAAIADGPETQDKTPKQRAA